MTNTWRKIPEIFRWLLVSLVIMTVVGLGAYAYRVLIIEGEGTVHEAIAVDPETFEFDLLPGETFIQTVTIYNKSSAELKVDLVPSISPADQGVSIKLSKNSLKVPGKDADGRGSVQVEIIIKAGNDAVPDKYKVTVPADRNKLDDDD